MELEKSFSNPNNMMASKIDINSKEHQKIIFLYKSALKELNVKIEMLQEEYEILDKDINIEYVKTRVKKNKSIIKKMNSKKLDLTYLDMINNVNDIAGMRIVCDFKDDIYEIARDITKIYGIKVIKCKDYIQNPKKSGYMSYHMLVEVPVNFENQIIHARVEIQIRTMAMDFWSSIEHDAKYKGETYLEQNDIKQFTKYSKYINNIENKMFKLVKGKNKILEC